MKIAIYGAGSLGTVLGAYLAKGHVAVDLINRNLAHVQALNENGATIVGHIQFNQKVQAYLPEQITEVYDIIFLLTKQQENPKVVTFLKDFLAPDGVIVTLQNGLPELAIGKIVGEERVLGCTVAWGATLLEPGVVEVTSGVETFTFCLGSLKNNDHPKIKDVKHLLEMMGEVEVESNFIGSRWSKLLVNSAFSGMSAVLGVTFGEVARHKKTRLIVQKLIKECIDVGHAAQIKIEPIQGKDVVKLLDYKGFIKRKISYMIIPIAIKKHNNLKASMLQDLEKGKKCEIEAINGVIKEYGQKYGIKTIYNNKVIEIVKQIEDGKLIPSFDNWHLFREVK